MKAIQRTLSVFMTVCMLLSMVSFPAAAEEAKRTVEMGFGEIQWTLLAEVDFAKKNKNYFDSGTIKPEYANTKVALIPVTMKATTGEQFDIRGAQFSIKFDPSVLQYKSPSDIASNIVMEDGTTKMGVTGTKNVDNANANGSITLNFVDINGETATVTNGSVIGLVFFFLKEDTKKNAQSEVSFGDKVSLTYGVEDSKPLYHDSIASAVGSVPAYEPNTTPVVTFDGNEATSGSMNPQTFQADTEQKLTKNAFVKTGYRFVGWSEAKDGEVKYTDEQSVKIAASVTLYAKWEPDTPAPVVTFDGNEATFGSMNPQTFQADTEQKLTKNAFVKTGYRFAGWSETKDGEVKYTDEQSVKIAASVTLYAKWTQGDIDIKPVAVPTEGGAVEANKTEAKEGDVIQLTVTPNTNGGYVLDTLTVTDNEGAIQYTRTNAYTTGNSTYTFTVRKSDVTVTANFVRPDGPPYSVTILPSEHGTVKAEDAQGNGVEKANPGDEVILRVTPDQDPVIGMYVLDTLTVKDSKNNVIPSPLKSGMDTTYQFSLHSFSMPDGPVTVEATFVGQPRVIVPESVERGRVTSDKRTAGAGETVTLTVAPNENCQLEELKVTDADGDIALTKVNETTYTFSMGATDATVSVRFVQTREVTVTYAPGKGSGDATTKTERLPLAAPGNPGFTPPSGKQFNGWTLPNSDTFYRVGAEITDLDDGATLTAHYTEGCYVATAVYGSYDCPEVWTLRRFRDNVLAKTWYGRLFIKLYYAISPTAVKLFGDMDWFQNFWRGKLDDMVSNLQADGFESTPYQDKDW